MAFQVSSSAWEPVSPLLFQHPALSVCLFVQMYEKEESGEVQEDDLAAILEIMLGVQDVELSCYFLALDNPDKESTTYGKRRFFLPSAVFQLQHKAMRYLRTRETTAGMIDSIHQCVHAVTVTFDFLSAPLRRISTVWRWFFPSPLHPPSAFFWNCQSSPVNSISLLSYEAISTNMNLEDLPSAPNKKRSTQTSGAVNLLCSDVKSS